MARPRFTPTDAQRSTVRRLTALGIRQDDIAEMIGLRSEKTLRTHFQSELTRGAAEANRQVAQSLYRQATSGKCPAASMFWLKRALLAQPKPEGDRAMARPRFTPTDEQRSIVKMLAALGIRQDDIAEMIGVHSEKTLRTHFQSELTRGAAEANRQVAQSLYRQATSGKCPAASMFWLKRALLAQPKPEGD